MTDITPGFTFSGGQLVSANNLNKVVGDAIINDQSIDAIKLSEDSVSGAIMGHATLPRADVSDQDYFLIYDVSESKIKKLEKIDLIGTLNIQFEGGVVSGTAGNQTTIDGSTGAIVMDTGNLTMNSGNLETNNAKIKGDLEVDGTIKGNIAYDGNQTFGGDLFIEGGEIVLGNDASIANGDNDIYFSRTTNSIIGLGHNGQTHSVTGTLGEFHAEDNFKINGRVKSTNGARIEGYYREDNNQSSGSYGLQVERGIQAEGGAINDAGITQMDTTLDKMRCWLSNDGPWFFADSLTDIYAMRWYHYDSNGTLQVTGGPYIQNIQFGDSDAGLELYVGGATRIGNKNQELRVNMDTLKLYPRNYGASKSASLMLSAINSSGNYSSWFIQSISAQMVGGNLTNFMVISADLPGNNNYVYFGSATNGCGLLAYGSYNSASGYTKNFRICHPVLEDKDLLHTSIEAPRADLIYRGKHTLGDAPVNLDTTQKMTEGTFVKLVKDVQVFVQNNSGWGRVKGRVEGNKLHIECENADSTDVIDWMVIGERNDEGYVNGGETDENGTFMTERDCLCEPELETPSDPVEATEKSVNAP